MGLFDWFSSTASAQPQPKNATQPLGPGRIISSSQDLEQLLTEGNTSSSGVSVTPESAMRVATVYGSVRLLSGVVANMPITISRRLNETETAPGRDTQLWKLLNRKPNRWQTPAVFKRMMQAHVLLRGNAYALKVQSRRRITSLLPLHPDRVEPHQNDDNSITYRYKPQKGGRVDLSQDDVMHLMLFTLDGVNGVTPITYARNTLGLALSMEDYGASTFANQARPSTVLVHPEQLGPEGRENLQASLDEFRSGGVSEGKSLILEEGMKVERLSMTSEDAQWLDSRKFSRTDIAMFFGVPLFMLGETEKDSSWGTGLEQQTNGFLNFVAEDHLTMWEEAITRDLTIEASNLEVAFDRTALVRGDIETRWERHVKSMQWGVESPNEIRNREGLNPRDDGDVYYPPPNTAGDPQGGDPDESA